jgi:N6-adenosine-specific RNA methylase IME4
MRARDKACQRYVLQSEENSVGQHRREPRIATTCPSIRGKGDIARSIKPEREEVGTTKKYNAIYADPPWQFSKKVGRGTTESHYPTMPLDEICALPVKDFGARWLFLWATNADLPNAFRVINAWGFEYKTMFTWIKPQIGVGNYYRTSTEQLLLGTTRPGQFNCKSQPNWIIAPRQEHSRKPEELYAIIERCVDGPYLELFARRKWREGWDFWGNEIESDLSLERTSVLI